MGECEAILSSVVTLVRRELYERSPFTVCHLLRSETDFRSSVQDTEDSDEPPGVRVCLGLSGDYYQRRSDSGPVFSTYRGIKLVPRRLGNSPTSLFQFFQKSRPCDADMGGCSPADGDKGHGALQQGQDQGQGQGGQR